MQYVNSAIQNYGCAQCAGDNPDCEICDGKGEVECNVIPSKPFKKIIAAIETLRVYSDYQNWILCKGYATEKNGNPWWFKNTYEPWLLAKEAIEGLEK